MYEWIAGFTLAPERLQQWSRRLARIPQPMVWTFCIGVGTLLFAFKRGMRRQIKRNLQSAFPNSGRLRSWFWTWRYCINFTISLYEILLDSRRLSEDSEDNRFQVEGEAALKEALEQGKGAIIYTPHVGNFFYYYWYLSRKYNALTVATAGSEELYPMYEHFKRLGCDGLDYDRTPSLQLYRKLREHLRRNGVVFLLGDFYRSAFPACTLFGLPSRTPGGAAALSLELGCEIIPMIGWRSKGFKHQIRYQSPIRLHERYTRNEQREAMAELSEIMEQLILQQPTQWLYWFDVHLRWRDQAAAQ